VGVAAGALALAGCGAGKDYKNAPRPPAPINVTAYVSPKRVSVSPSSFGAGPIVVIVTNQSSRSQEVTFQTPDRRTLSQSTLINPGDTGQLKLDVTEGRYQLTTGDGTIKPATISVGAQRSSAQNQLLEP
jgi:hypothetical protein